MQQNRKAFSEYSAQILPLRLRAPPEH